jgi:pimeloyl-ACP methyl ester carboxylesterase
MIAISGAKVGSRRGKPYFCARNRDHEHAAAGAVGTRGQRAGIDRNPPAVDHAHVIDGMTSVRPAAETGRPPVLFVHGLGHGAWCWAEHWLAVAADRGYPAHALTLRGYADGDGRGRWRVTIGDYVADVARAAASLPTAPVLVGHSMGGLVVQRALARVRPPAAVLVTPVPPRHGLLTFATVLRHQPGAALGALVGRSLHFRPRQLFTGLDRSTAAALAARQKKTAPITLYQMTLPRRTPRPVDPPPMLLLAATADRIIPRSDIAQTARFWGVQPRWYDGIGHDVMLDDGWRRPLDDLLDWLDETLPETPTGTRTDPTTA